ncbi:sugar phosphate isomerase/epimerase family protein [Mobiluncus mulieris]|uniref:sugar phosphate isomerase/epimerase family protein n=1 Tax=Mobiluncus mulieris TaxID=2052 RepID=UPI00295F2597|nr:sugar phosphate isomerase/epimerase [Mobiluncus mulieris]
MDDLLKAQKETGVKIETLNPVFNWSAVDEQERQAQVRNWRSLLEAADRLNVRQIVSEFSGNPNTALACEHQWYKSIEELTPDFEKYGIRLAMEPHPYDFVEVHDDAYQIIRGANKDWLGYEYCAPHTFHISQGKGDIDRMIHHSAKKLFEVHVADAYNHVANDGNRYIVNPPGVDARVHQHNELGQGEVNWEMLFTALREVGFDGVFSVCIFGWHEWADEMNQRVLTRLQQEFS